MSDVIIPVLNDKALSDKETIKPSSWLTTIDFIKRLTLDANILVAVLGEKGSGKTTFMAILQSLLASSFKTCVMKPGHLFNKGIFGQQMKESLGLDSNLSWSSVIEKINEQKQHVLMVIDDAHFLSSVFVEEMLKELHRQENTHFFHVCLVSDFSLVTVLNRLAKHTYKDMVHSIELGSLTESETKQYVLSHHLARQNVDITLTEANIKQFYQLTAGHLADINRQMTLFFRNQANSMPHHDLFVRYLAIAAGFLMVTIGASYIWRSQDFQSVLMAWMNQSQTSNVHHSVIAVSPSKGKRVYRSEIAAYDEFVVRQNMQATSLRRADLEMMDEEDATLDESLAVVDKVIVAPKIIQQHVAEKKAELKANILPKPIKKRELKLVLTEQTPYTIQILASHNKEKLKLFAKKYHLVEKVQLCHTKRQGKDWYVITLGRYKDRQNANLAFRSLPKEIVQFKPWVRILGDLKAVG